MTVKKFKLNKIRGRKSLFSLSLNSNELNVRKKERYKKIYHALLNFFYVS